VMPTRPARRILALPAALALCAGCSSSQAPASTTASSSSTPLQRPHETASQDAAVVGAPAETDEWNAAVRGEHTETIHGVEVADPYRRLGAASPATRTWIEQQTARAARYLAAHTRPGTAERLAALPEIGSITGPRVAGGK